MLPIICTAGSRSGRLHESRSITASDTGAAPLSFGNIACIRWAITPVCSVICITNSITKTRIYNASALCDCSGWESAVSVKKGYGSSPASRPAAQMQRKTTSPVSSVRPVR